MPDEHQEIIRNINEKLEVIFAYVVLGKEPGTRIDDQQLNIGKAIMKYYFVEDVIRDAVLPRLLPTNKGE